MLNICLKILLTGGLIYSYVVFGKWHKRSKKNNVIAKEVSKKLKRDAGCIVSNTILGDVSSIVQPAQIERCNRGV